MLQTVLNYLNRFRKKVLRKKVEWHNLRSVVPISIVYGLDRGQAIDRYYIENFLSDNMEHIRGSVLEMACAGVAAHVTRRSDVYWLPRYLVRDWSGNEFVHCLKG